MSRAHEWIILRNISQPPYTHISTPQPSARQRGWPGVRTDVFAAVPAAVHSEVRLRLDTEDAHGTKAEGGFPPLENSPRSSHPMTNHNTFMHARLYWANDDPLCYVSVAAALRAHRGPLPWRTLHSGCIGGLRARAKVSSLPVPPEHALWLLLQLKIHHIYQSVLRHKLPV